LQRFATNGKGDEKLPQAQGIERGNAKIMRLCLLRDQRFPFFHMEIRAVGQKSGLGYKASIMGSDGSNGRFKAEEKSDLTRSHQAPWHSSKEDRL
jgi:hypothetical protein